MNRLLTLTLILVLAGLPPVPGALAAAREDNRPPMFRKIPPQQTPQSPFRNPQTPPPTPQQLPPGQLPPSQLPPGQVPPGQLPPGKMPAPEVPPRSTLDGTGCCKGGRAVGCRAGKVLCADGSLSSTCPCPREDTRP